MLKQQVGTHQIVITLRKCKLEIFVLHSRFIILSDQPSKISIKLVCNVSACSNFLLLNANDKTKQVPEIYA